MHILSTISDMHAWSAKARMAGKRIAFVPTMGFLHNGHCTLMSRAREQADALVVSIFVNPTQFAPNEDLSRYPRDLEGDLAKCRDVGADVVFTPSIEEVYPPGDETRVIVPSLGQVLCGASRPGHFNGVATVVCKLFNMVQPTLAFFGEKDYQQLQIVRRMVADLKMPIKIVSVPTVREADGLAMSSRNSYLSPNERSRALSLHQGLMAAKQLAEKGEQDPVKLVMAVRNSLNAAQARVDYISFCDAQTLEALAHWKSPALLAVAAWIGTTRLIDNHIFR